MITQTCNGIVIWIASLTSYGIIALERLMFRIRVMKGARTLCSIVLNSCGDI